MTGFDPFMLTEKVREKIVQVRNGTEYRMYYRFRGGKWYGGIATGDVVGCNLRCKFCWSWRYSHGYKDGRFYNAYQVFHRLTNIASRRRYKYLRLSGGEPTLSQNHLLQLLDLVDETDYLFVLETNGLLIGRDKKFAEKLAIHKSVIVRVSFKGASPDEFERLTGASKKFYDYQFKALENLVDAGLEPGERVYPAIMLSFSEPENIKWFVEKLKSIDPSLPESIDPEYVILYPHVVDLMKRYGLKPRKAFRPDGLPGFMI